MNALVGDLKSPLTGPELLFQLSNGVPVQIGRAYLSIALLLVERYAQAEIDVQIDGAKAFLTPRKCELNDEGRAYIANHQVTKTESPALVSSCPGVEK
jgi:hypothetical protein